MDLIVSVPEFSYLLWSNFRIKYGKKLRGPNKCCPDDRS